MAPIFFSRLYIFILIALWVYFFIYSYRYRNPLPWGFGIVIIGVRLLGFGYDFYNHETLILVIDLSFIVCLVGVLWNINNIRNQFYVENIGKFLWFITVGLTFGLLFGLLFLIRSEAKDFEPGSQYTITALIVSSIQSSLAQEFLITGYLLSYLRRCGFTQIIAILFQAILFAVWHIPRYSGDGVALFIVFLFGMVAGYLTWKNNNLISAFVLHSVANLIPVIWLLSIASA